MIETLESWHSSVGSCQFFWLLVRTLAKTSFLVASANSICNYSGFMELKGAIWGYDSVAGWVGTKQLVLCVCSVTLSKPIRTWHPWRPERTHTEINELTSKQVPQDLSSQPFRNSGSICKRNVVFRS